MAEEKAAMNEKARKFQEFLDAQNIKAFAVENVEDELNSAVFRSRMEVGGQELPTAVIIDNSIYTMIRVQIVGGMVYEEMRDRIAVFLNGLNGRYKIFKYYVTEKGDLCLDSCLPFTEENFDGELIRTILNVMMQHLTETYPELMRNVWAK